MGMLVASAALAKTGGLGFMRLTAAGDVTSSCPSPTPSPSPSESPSPSPSPSESPSPDQGTSDEQESDDQSTTDEQESDDQGTSEQESGDCKDSNKDKKTGGNTADRQKACMDAAGMSGSTAGTGSSQVKTTGLDHAIEMVLANCIKNPQAPGLLNALRHLVANRERHAAHDEEKAARKAAHDAAKASKGHGH